MPVFRRTFLVDLQWEFERDDFHPHWRTHHHYFPLGKPLSKAKRKFSIVCLHIHNLTHKTGSKFGTSSAIALGPAHGLIKVLSMLERDIIGPVEYVTLACISHNITIFC